MCVLLPGNFDGEGLIVGRCCAFVETLVIATAKAPVFSGVSAQFQRKDNGLQRPAPPETRRRVCFRSLEGIDSAALCYRSAGFELNLPPFDSSMRGRLCKCLCSFFFV